eukprot:c3433_g1_i2.p1 GENE.c3433_g1_i2~~c3433_g1_i2.p1  ORF type:complete len:440 (-),score=68.10 c3433_g1_i2:148-1467(-)
MKLFNTFLFLALLYLTRATFDNSTNTVVDVKQWCNNLWVESNPECIVGAICIPSHTKGPLGQKGVCSCELRDSALANRYTTAFNSSGQYRSLTQCARTNFTNVYIACFLAMSFGAFILSVLFAKSIHQARKQCLFRFDVLGVSQCLLGVAAILLCLTRFNRALQLSTFLQASRRVFELDRKLHIILSVVMSFFIVAGALFFAVALTMTLANTTRVMGITPTTRTPVTTAKQIGIVVGSLVALGIFLGSMFGKQEINALMVAVACVVMLLSYVFLIKTLARTIRYHPASERFESVRLPALLVISQLSTRLFLHQFLLLLVSLLYAVFMSLGRQQLSDDVIRYGAGITAVLEYFEVLMLGFVLVQSINKLLNAKIQASKGERSVAFVSLPHTSVVQSVVPLTPKSRFPEATTSQDSPTRQFSRSKSITTIIPLAYFHPQAN